MKFTTYLKEIGLKPFAYLLLLALALPVYAQYAQFENPLGSGTNVVTILVGIIKFFLGIAALIALLAIVIGGVRLTIGGFDNEQEAARANLIFGLHVHVGVPNREVGIQIMNAARYFIPHIFALSTNSPFWLGRNTGFKSYRVKVFDKFPRTGIPDYYDSVSEFDNYVNLLVKTNCIDNGKKIWYDIRLHPYFNTLEFRMCDITMRIDETICLAAIMQAVVVKLYKLMRQNLGFRIYRRALINENKWRAARYGIDGKLIDFGKQEEVDFKILVMELLSFVSDVMDDLNSWDEVNYVLQILQNGTGADRQLAHWDGTDEGLKKVVDYIIEETHTGIT